MSGNSGDHPIKDGSRPAGSGQYGDLNHVRWLIENTDPAAVSAAGTAWLSAAKELAELHTNIRAAAAALANAYGGESGAAAQQALRRVHATAVEVGHRSKQLGDALHWYGEDILPWYKEHKPGSGLIHSGKDDKYATEYMQRLNERIAQAHDAMPSQVSKDLPGVGRRNPMDQATSNASGSISGMHVNTPEGGSSSTFGGRNASVDHDSGAPQPGGADKNVSAGGTDLAGLQRPGGVTGGLGGSGGGFGGPGGVSGSLPGGMPGSGAPGGAVGPAVFGPGAASGGRPGGRGAAGRGGTGGQMVPGAGQGQGEQEQERTRDFWLAEDPEIWGAGEGVPSVIGTSPVPAEPDIEDAADQDEILDILLDEESDPGGDSATSKERSEPARLDAPSELRGPDWLA